MFAGHRGDSRSRKPFSKPLSMSFSKPFSMSLSAFSKPFGNRAARPRRALPTTSGSGAPFSVELPRTVRILIASIVALGVLAGLAVTSVVAEAAPGCATNAIVCENALPGTPADQWDIDGSGDQTIQGFGTQMSVNTGEAIQFKVDTDATAYGIQIFRLGWYQGLGARKVADVTPSASLPQTQPACATDPATEIYDCGTWGVSASWNVPADAVSGVYLALLTRSDTGGRSQIPFVVRDDASASTAVFQTSDATWQAYNTYGGSDFYAGKAHGRAYKVSYNRPWLTRGAVQGRDYLFANEYPMLRFLERNGYDLTYISSLDTDIRGANLKKHKTFISTGHDEYWSQGQRDNVEAARDAGVNLAFFSGNEVYWRTRWEASQDGSNTANRTLVCYKDTWSADAPLDPVSPTSTWRDARGIGKPENALTGTIYKSNDTDLAITVSGAEGKLRLWRNTTLGAQADTATTALAKHTVGYESDEDLDNGFRPAGLVRLSTTTGPTPQYLTDFGATVTTGTTTHHLTLYKASSGALVFGAGTIQWAWGLDTYHDGTVEPVDTRMQQATVNLLADMSTLPASLSTPNVTAATKSTDTTAPVATIAAPSVGASLVQNTAVTVSGTATDTGGQVAGVEVSLDAGKSWHPATGRTSWSYSGLVAGTGANAVQVRAIDDSGNIQPNPATLATTVVCPCTLFGATVPGTTAVTDGSALTLGVRFTASTDGFITGVRFYKGAGNTGTHTGTLYAASGAPLATVTFTDETATGWQTATFATAVPVTAGVTYVAAYTAPNGRYAADSWYYGYSDVVAGPLSADGGKKPNGVYAVGTSAFPNTTYKQTNYWVDVVYSSVDTTPLTVAAVAPISDAGSVPVTSPISAKLSRDPIATTISFTLKTTGQNGVAGQSVAGTTSYDSATRTVTFTPSAPLAAGTVYTAAVSATPLASGIANKPASWTFSTARAAQVAGSCPCSLYDDTDLPAVPASDDTASVEVGTAFSSDTAGQITGIEFYKGVGNGGSHTVSLWNAAGEKLASAAVTSETAVGWQVATFDAPVTIAANTTYIASYRAPQGRYAATAGAFAQPTDRAPLHTLANAGRYTYGSGAPTNASAASYFVDPVFTVSSANPPKVAALTPADRTTSTPVSTAVTATFDGSVKPGSATITVADANGTAVAGSMAAPTVGTTATFTPSAPLAAGQTYTVTVSGAKNLGGTAMTAFVSSTFTTSGVMACPCTLLASSAKPALSDAGDASAITVGTRFTTNTDGYIVSLRYWRDAANTGTHTGALYAGTQKLAGVTFADSGTGWQSAKLDTPVAVTANTTYVVAVSMPNGHYAAASEFFANPFVNLPLTGTQGVYGNGVDVIPTNSYRNTFYYVDAAFALSNDSTPPVISNVAVSGSGKTATISWTTDEATDGSIAYGTSATSLTGKVSETGAGTSHSVQLSGLTVGTTYSYRITSTDASGNSTTVPANGTAARSWEQASPATNVAQGRTAWQSSTSYDGAASRAVDGNTDGAYANGTTTHSDTNSWSWWQVDLGGSYRPSQIVLWNRTDCCGDRLRDYWVFVSDSPFDTALTPAQQAAKAGVWSSHQTVQPNPKSAISLPAEVSGRYVMVQEGVQWTYLSLAEVQVMVPPATLSVTGGPVDFGSVGNGTSKTATVTLANYGSTPLTVTDYSATKAPFSVSPSLAGQVVNPGASLAATVTYAPTVLGSSDSGSFSVTADDDNGATKVALSGTSVIPSVNLSQGKPVSQSSTASGWAERAVDGNTDGNWYNNSTTHTNWDQASWWQVDLQGSYRTTQIVLWNRTDCCGERLQDYYVFVSNTPFDTTLTPAQLAAKSGVWSTHRTVQPSPSTAITLPAGTNGRYVMVQLGSALTPLSLAEVQVLGYGIGSMSVSATKVDLGTVNVGATRTGTVTVANTGTGALTITDSTEPKAPFSVSPNLTGKTLAAGESVTATVTYAPTAVSGGDTGSFSVTADDGSGAGTVALTGAATPAPVNLAKDKTATQSSNLTIGPYVASRAIDGNTDGVLANNSVSHTDADAWAWWQVDLKATYKPNQIVVWNRTDCCADRLKDYWVFVSDSPFDTKLTPAQQAAKAGVWSNHQTAQPGPSTAISVPSGTTGRYVMVQQGTQGQYLTLAEVQVFGDTAGLLSASSTSVDLGSIVKDTTRTATVTLTNTGSAGVKITDYSGPKAPFSVSPDLAGKTIAAGETLTATISYAPTAVSAADNGSFTVTADDGKGSTKVSLTGIATIPMTNVSQGKSASQSSTINGFEASRAVDGKTDGVVGNGSVAHTDNNQAYQWWQVDLKGVYTTNQIVMWNRTDCCADRLKDYWVFVSETPFNTSLTPTQQAAVAGVWSTRQTSQPNPTGYITIPNNVKGRYVMVQQSAQGVYLQLAEVQVMGNGIGSMSASATKLDLGSVVIGSTRTGTVNLTNTGTGAVKISTYGAPKAPFSVSPDLAGKTIAAGETLTATISYAPTAISAADSGSFTVTADDGKGETKVNLTGIATIPTVNVSQGKTATQSSTYESNSASRAVDGKTDGVLNNGSVAHTGDNQYSWWQVDLKGVYTANQVVLWNRTDCCADRLRDYWVFVSETPFNTSLTPTQQAAAAGVWSSRQTSQPNPTTYVTVPNGTKGRYVMVQQNLQYTHLQLAEVQVMGNGIGSMSASTTKLDLGSVVAGTTKTGTVTLTNTGTGAVKISTYTAPKAPFSLSPDLAGKTIAAGETLTATVTYAPTAAATADSGSFAVTADDGKGETKVTLAGAATAAPSNLAKGKTATQSSTGYGGLASRAVDGNTDGVYNNNSVSHTNDETNSWWRVDLGASSKLNQVVVWNRTDCCADRMKDFYVFVSNTAFDTSLTPAQQAAKSGVWSTRLTSQPNPSTTINLPSGTTGRYVMVQQNLKSTAITLAEVQVVGTP